MNYHQIGRWATLHKTPEVTKLKAGMDFRQPQYRREVFLRFYEFHLENRSHPGAVYYAMPWLIKKQKLDEEQKLWMVFLNGNTQNIVTTWTILKRFPDLTATNINKLATWFNKHYDNLPWDTDRRYHKKDFLKAVESYHRLVETSQRKFFRNWEQATEEETFQQIWRTIREDFYTFGRLSTFSYMEYLRIVGLPLQCDKLFLEDMSGSKSHRNGLAKVLGRDDLDWYKDNTFTGDYASGQLPWLEAEAAALLTDARKRTASNPDVNPRDVNYFTLESIFCTYKSWHRKNRRYANVYNDMFYNRIKKAEAFGWPEEAALFWKCREQNVKPWLRLECCPHDPGLVPEKQNYYRNTGHVIMMSKRWPEFTNHFDETIWQVIR